MPNTPDACWSNLSSSDSDALMLDFIWPLLKRAVGVLRLHAALGSLVCTALFLSIGETAHAESRAMKKVGAHPASQSELQQPGHMLPLPASAVPSDSKSTGDSAGPIPRPLRQPTGKARSVTSLDSIDYIRMPNQSSTRQVNFQKPPKLPTAPADKPAAPSAPGDKDRDRCASLVGQSFSDFGINIEMPAGDAPEDHASKCWEPINEGAGPLVGARSWGATTFNWNATCLCHRPLYFEEINLERYGYGCCESLQPAASAAHFFATIPTLPYCIATDCPCDCIYTLGHYRPGNCNPWQCHWPRWSTRAGLAEGGVWTGMVFLIP
jgi:hypothetical protein